MAPTAFNSASAIVSERPTASFSATHALQQLSPSVLNFISTSGRTVDAPHLPLSNTLSGSLLASADTGTTQWYVPRHAVVPATDTSFSFCATRTSQVDSDGNPFNVVSLTLRVAQTPQDDADAFRATHPNSALQPVALDIQVATLVTTCANATTGELMQVRYQGMVSVQADNSLQLEFDNIVGAGVVALFQNLKTTAGAQVILSGSFPALSRGPLHIEPRVLRPITLTRPVSTVPLASPMLARRWLPEETPTSGDTTPPLVQIDVPYTFSVPLGTVFASDAYQLAYTITSPSGSRTITSIEDLKSFNAPQTEFAELKSLGDIGARYPSLSQAYIGVLSKTIVVVPRRYAIVRGKGGCAAACFALVDSSPSMTSRCKFEFTFCLAPDASPVEMLLFGQEIATHPELSKYTIRFPDYLAETRPSKLFTVFQSNSSFTEGADPHMFVLCIDLVDDSIDSPAINNANLLITALSTSEQPYLTGVLHLKLDDNFPEDVQSTIVLNFADTCGSDDLYSSIDDVGGTLALTNRSPLDLYLRRYILGVPGSASATDSSLTLAASQSTTIALPVQHADYHFCADTSLSLPSPLPKSAIARYLAISVQDVADTQFSVSVNASAVDFVHRDIESIVTQITFPSISGLMPPSFSLDRLSTANSARILVPITAAITELVGTVQCTVRFHDPQKPDLQFARQNDFCSNAICVLSDGDLDSMKGDPNN